VAQAAGEVLSEADLHGLVPSAPRVHQGLVISGDLFVDTTSESTALRLALPEALAVEMEGAALAQVCHDFGVPFAVIRTISDRADDAAHVDFQRFVLEVASRYSLAVVKAVLERLPR
jgi:adenosylhomocysteine nucleosidase